MSFCACAVRDGYAREGRISLLWVEAKEDAIEQSCRDDRALLAVVKGTDDTGSGSVADHVDIVLTFLLLFSTWSETARACG